MAATIFAQKTPSDTWTPADAAAIAAAIFGLIVQENAPPPKDCKRGHGPLQGFQARKSGKSQRYCLACDIINKKNQREAKVGEKKQLSRKSVEELVARRLARTKPISESKITPH